MGWWRHLKGMPDRERARMLARASLVLILVLLYGLGGASLYLRHRYLGQPVNSPAPTATPTLPAVAPEANASPLPTATLYPTLTPAGPGAGVWPTLTPSR